MLIVDDILLAPFRGLLWIFQEINNAAEQELVNEADNITAQLSELYLRLESGSISEEEFDEQEKVLLDRLEELDERDGRIGYDQETGEG